MVQKNSEYVQKENTKGVHYISIFKAINNSQGTFCTYMVIKAMAPEGQAFSELRRELYEASELRYDNHPCLRVHVCETPSERIT